MSQQPSGPQDSEHQWLWLFLIPCVIVATGVLIWGQLTSHVAISTTIGDSLIALGIILAFFQVYNAPILSRGKRISFAIALGISLIIMIAFTVKAVEPQQVGQRTPISRSLPRPTPSPEEMLQVDEKIAPVYNNALNSQTNPLIEGWDTSSSNQSFGAACKFNAEGYDVSVSNGSTQYGNPSFCQAKQPYENVLIEVTVHITDGTAALLFRDQYYKGSWGYYSFQIDPGKRQFKITINGDSFPHTSWQIFPAGVPSGSTYTLQVIAQGSTFYFFIDKQFTAKASDITYMEGSIGFVCYNGQGTKIGNAEFSSVSVRNLPD